MTRRKARRLRIKRNAHVRSEDCLRGLVRKMKRQLKLGTLPPGMTVVT